MNQTVIEATVFFVVFVFCVALLSVFVASLYAYVPCEAHQQIKHVMDSLIDVLFKSMALLLASAIAYFVISLLIERSRKTTQ